VIEGGGVKQVLADLFDFGDNVFFFITLVVQIIHGRILFGINEAICQTTTGIIRRIQNLIRKLHTQRTTISVLDIEVIFDILRRVVNGAVPVEEHSNLDTTTCSLLRVVVFNAHGTRIVLLLAIDAIQLLTFNEFSSFEKAKLLHIFNLFAFLVTSRLVNLITDVRRWWSNQELVGITIETGRAIFFLFLPSILDHGLEVGFHVDDDLAVSGIMARRLAA